MRGILKRRAAPADGVSNSRRGFWREDGITIVEMSISCAVLLSMFFGIFEFSMAIYTMHFIAEATREASRYAMVNGSACAGMPDCGFSDSNTTLKRYITSNFNYPGLTGSRLTVTSSWYYPVPAGTPNPTWTACGNGDTCNDPGDLVKVTATYPYQLAIPFWGMTTINITNSSEMVISQ